MKKIIDLNPKGITPEELEEMKGLNRAYQEFKLRIADAEIQKAQALDGVRAVEARMGKFNNDLVEKYKVSEDTRIDMHTGEFKS